MSTIQSELMRQCWENAYTSQGLYRVPVESAARAIAFRSQCHKYRRKIAEQIYGPNFEEHYLYDLQVSIEGLYVVFSPRPRVQLPPVVLPPVGRQSPVEIVTEKWCLLQKGKGMEVRRLPTPVRDPGLIGEYESQDEAEAAKIRLEEAAKVFESRIFPQ